MSVPALAGQYSPDGRWWWDGTRWLPVAPPPVYPLARYAGFWARLAGLFIDGLVLAIPGFVVQATIGAASGIASATVTDDTTRTLITSVGSLFSSLASTALAWLYAAFMTSSSYQATLGQMALGIKVTDLRGHRISFARASGRYFASWLSVLLCFIGGYLVMLFNEREQTLHDLVAGTVVVTRATPPGTLPAPGAQGSGGGTALLVVLSFGGVLLLVSILVVVILLTMGGQISNVFSNVVVALNG